MEETRIAVNKEGNYILHIDNFVHDVHNKLEWYSCIDGSRVTPVGCKPNKEYKNRKHYKREPKYTDRSNFKRGCQTDFLHSMVCAFIAGLPSIKVGDFDTTLTFIASDKNTFSFKTIWDNIKGNVRADVSFDELIVEVTRTSDISTKKVECYRLINKPFLNIHIPQENKKRSNEIEAAIINGDIHESVRLILENCSFAMSVSEWIRDIEYARTKKIIQIKLDEEKRRTGYYKHRSEYLSDMCNEKSKRIDSLEKAIESLKESEDLRWVVEIDSKSGGIVYDSYHEKCACNQVKDPLSASVFHSFEEVSKRVNTLKYGAPRAVLLKQAVVRFKTNTSQAN